MPWNYSMHYAWHIFLMAMHWTHTEIGAVQYHTISQLRYSTALLLTLDDKLDCTSRMQLYQGHPPWGNSAAMAANKVKSHSLSAGKWKYTLHTSVNIRIPRQGLISPAKILWNRPKTAHTHTLYFDSNQLHQNALWAALSPQSSHTTVSPHVTPSTAFLTSVLMCDSWHSSVPLTALLQQPGRHWKNIQERQGIAARNTRFAGKEINSQLCGGLQWGISIVSQ